MPLSAKQRAAVHQAAQADFSGLMLLDPPTNWPLGPATSEAAGNSKSRAHIAILDSSFNPPQLAHLALASSAFPPVSSTTTPVLSTNAHGSERGDSRDPDPGPYTARLLLYSSRNADKLLKPGDATPTQRAEMMVLQAEAVEALPQSDNLSVAVGFVSAPTFVLKATELGKALSAHVEHSHSHASSGQDPTFTPVALTFLVGMDTLVRIFDTKYYPPTTSDPKSGLHNAMHTLFTHSYLVVAPRGSSPADRAAEDALIAHPDVAPWVARGRIRLLPPSTGVLDVNSTIVRAAVRTGQEEEMAGLVVPAVARYIVQQGLYKA